MSTDTELIFQNMRLFHNWIKRLLIQKYATKVDFLLDLSSGKGGDMKKWIDNGIKKVVGYDIDKKAVDEANRRLSELNKINTKIEFKILDLSKFVVLEKNVDVITSMFAFHYMFQNEEGFHTIMKTLVTNLKIGGYFIGCIFDSDEILKLLSSGNFNDDNFSIKLLSTTETKFGNTIEVFIKNTVLNVPTKEYIVDFKFLISMMEKNGFQLIETKMFSRLYKNWRNNVRFLSRKERTLSFLNRTFVFRRIS